MATRTSYKSGRKKTTRINPKRSKASKKGAKTRRGKPLSSAHRKAISKGLRKSKVAKRSRKARAK